MHKNTTSVAAIILVLLICMNMLVGCGAHGALSTVPRYDITPVPGANPRSPHNRKIFVTTASLDPNWYEIVARLDVTKIWYGYSETLLNDLANMARKVGADAVIEVKIWRKPVGWSMASPQGTGKAVVLKKPIDTSVSSGEYR